MCRTRCHRAAAKFQGGSSPHPQPGAQHLHEQKHGNRIFDGDTMNSVFLILVFGRTLACFINLRLENSHHRRTGAKARDVEHLYRRRVGKPQYWQTPILLPTLHSLLTSHLSPNGGFSDPEIQPIPQTTCRNLLRGFRVPPSSPGDHSLRLWQVAFKNSNMTSLYLQPPSPTG